MTFRVLDSRETSQFFSTADAGVLSRPAHSFDNLSPSALFRTSLPETQPDGDCLRALGMAVGIEAAAAILALGAWMLWQALR